jgi:hypothetical protein
MTPTARTARDTTAVAHPRHAVMVVAATLAMMWATIAMVVYLFASA